MESHGEVGSSPRVCVEDDFGPAPGFRDDFLNAAEGTDGRIDRSGVGVIAERQ